MAREKVTLYITNNTSATIPLAILSNPNDLDNANADTSYKWDFTGISFAAGNITSLALQYKPTGSGAFTTFTYSANITSFNQLLSILNGIGISLFYQLPIGGYTYLVTSTENYVFGSIIILPASSYVFNFTASNVIGVPTLSVKLNFTAPTDITIDWGEGATQVFMAQLGNITYPHTYSTTGLDTFMINVTVSAISQLSQVQFSTALNISAIADISSFSALTSLLCQTNLLTALPNLPATITTLNCSTNNITTAQINAALIVLDGYGLLAGTFISNGQTPAAPPSGAGTTAKNNLIGKGWTVTTD